MAQVVTVLAVVQDLQVQSQPHTKILHKHKRVGYGQVKHREGHLGLVIIVVYILGNDRVDIFYRVPNPSTWMYYLQNPSMNRVLFVYM